MIKAGGISKKFKLYHSPADRLREILFRKQYHKDFVAPGNISFEIGAGQTLGIIGQNGAGKSTLLKILSGIVIPDSGSIQIDGARLNASYIPVHSQNNLQYEEL